MSNFRKVRLLDEDELSHILEKRIKDYNPNLHVLAQMQMELDSILSKGNISAEEQLALFKGVQNKYHHLKSQYSQLNNPSPIPNPSSTKGERASALDSHSRPINDEINPALDPDREISTAGEREPETESEDALDQVKVEGLQNKFQVKLSNLISLMKENSNIINVDPHSNEVILKGKKVSGSNISDLILNLYRFSQNRNPKGASEFRNILHEIFLSNQDLVPSEYISNQNVLTDFGHPTSASSSTPNRYTHSSFKASQTGKGNSFSTSPSSMNSTSHHSESSRPPGTQIKVLYLYPH